jgi:hypothetical protein
VSGVAEQGDARDAGPSVTDRQRVDGPRHEGAVGLIDILQTEGISRSLREMATTASEMKRVAKSQAARMWRSTDDDTLGRNHPVRHKAAPLTTVKARFLCCRSGDLIHARDGGAR